MQLHSAWRFDVPTCFGFRVEEDFISKLVTQLHDSHVEVGLPIARKSAQIAEDSALEFESLYNGDNFRADEILVVANSDQAQQLRESWAQTLAEQNNYQSFFE